MERLEMIVSVIIYQNIYIKSKKDHTKKISETTSIKKQSQHWGVNRQLSMEVIVVEYFLISVEMGAMRKSRFRS